MLLFYQVAARLSPVACWVLFFFGGGGGSGLSTMMHPHILQRLINEGRRHYPRAQQVRGFSIGGSGGMPPQKIFEFRVSEMPFPGLWGEGLTEI